MNNPERKFKTLQDITILDEAEFQRFLPDFVAWFSYAKQAQKIGLEAINMEWTDDGHTGVLTHVNLQMPDGEVVHIDLEAGL